MQHPVQQWLCCLGCSWMMHGLQLPWLQGPWELYEPLVVLQDEDSVLTSLGTHTTWDQVVTLLHMELFSEKEAVMLQGRWQCVMP